MPRLDRGCSHFLSWFEGLPGVTPALCALCTQSWLSLLLCRSPELLQPSQSASSSATSKGSNQPHSPAHCPLLCLVHLELELGQDQSLTLIAHLSPYKESGAPWCLQPHAPRQAQRGQNPSPCRWEGNRAIQHDAPRTPLPHTPPTQQDTIM